MHLARRTPVARLRINWRWACALLVCTACFGLGLVAQAQPEPPSPPAPDLAFYAKHVAPWIADNCASCHRTGGGGLRLASADAALAKRQQHDFEQLTRFVVSDAPQSSRLYTKILDPAEGGDEHAGGAFLREDEEIHDVFLDFLSGATLTNVPPEPWFEHDAIQAVPGKPLEVSGRDSYDRGRDDMENLRYWWTLISRPADSRVVIEDRQASRLRVTPDSSGSYVLSLRVGDGKVWSAARRVSVEVFRRATVNKQAAGGISGLERVRARELRQIRRLYFDVLGRPPTPAEVLAEASRGVRPLAKNIVLRAESGRAWVEELCVWLDLIGDARPRGEAARALALRIPAESMAPPDVEAVLVRDEAFVEQHPPGAPLAQALIGRLLNREPTEDELEGARILAAGMPMQWNGASVNDSAAWIDAVLRSESFARAATIRRLRRFLHAGDTHRRIEEALLCIQEGSASWLAFLQKQIAWAAKNRSGFLPKGPATTVRGLFLDLVERAPTDREMAALLTALKRMPSQEAGFAVLAKILIDSGAAPLPLLVDIRDAPAWIADRFFRYYGRAPKTSELKAFGEALLHPDGGPELVVLALVTSPEYAGR